MTTATAIEPAKPKDTSFFLIGGGQKEVSEDDLKHITFSIKVNVECKNDEREVTAVVPIYEHTLLQSMWSRIGGEARLVSDWLPAAAKYPRMVKLSRDMLRDEIQRLESTYRTHLPNGTVKNYFKETFGRDGDPVTGFYKVINLQVRAWHALSEKVRRGHRLISEDLVAISNIARPESLIASPDEVSNFNDVTIEEGAVPERLEGEIDEDPLADIQNFLYDRNWSSEVVMDLCKLLGDGESPAKIRINDLPSLHGKKADQSRLMTDFKAFVARSEKNKSDAKLNAESAIKTVTM
jgi:hypothetical protein